ncbi:hypothetical protein ACSBR1_032781 [Camellia fascicularis]
MRRGEESFRHINNSGFFSFEPSALTKHQSILFPLSLPSRVKKKPKKETFLAVTSSATKLLQPNTNTGFRSGKLLSLYQRVSNAGL